MRVLLNSWKKKSACKKNFFELFWITRSSSKTHGFPSLFAEIYPSQLAMVGVPVSLRWIQPQRNALSTYYNFKAADTNRQTGRIPFRKLISSERSTNHTKPPSLDVRRRCARLSHFETLHFLEAFLELFKKINRLNHSDNPMLRERV